MAAIHHPTPPAHTTRHPTRHPAYLAAWLGCGLFVSFAATAVTQTRTSAFEYDPVTGLVSKEIIEPDSPDLCLVSSYTYDSLGNRTSITTRNCNGSSGEAPAPVGAALFSSRTSRSVYDARGQFTITSYNALNHPISRTYDPRFGAVQSTTDANQLTTTWQLDALGRKTLETRPDGTTTQWVYELCNSIAGGTATCPTYGVMVVTTTTPGSPIVKTYSNNLGREIRVESQGADGTWIRTDTQYDSLGRIAQVSQPYYINATPVWTTYTYDVLDRVISEAAPATTAGTRTVTTTYSALAVTTSVNTSPAQTKTISRNSQGQALTVSDSQGNLISYLYDPFGNLRQTNAGGVISTIDYDSRGRKTRIADPDMGIWRYTYNALGELTAQTDAVGQLTTLAYDKLGRLIQRSEPALTANWYYDSYQDGAACNKGLGRLCQSQASNGYNRRVSYDSLGRTQTLDVAVDTAYTISSSYVASGIHLGKLDTLTYPTGFAVKHLYSSTGQLSEIRKADDYSLIWQAGARNAVHQVTQENLGNGLQTIRSYDALNRPTQITASQPGNSVQDQRYTYDLAGNLASRLDASLGITENFTYDNLNRLTSATGPGLATRTFGYDALGNITAKSDTGSYTYPPSASPRPHAVTGITGSNAASYSYNANGEMIAASYANGDSRTLSYTSLGLPTIVQTTLNGQSYSHSYMYNNERERIALTIDRPAGRFTNIYLHPAGKGQLHYEKEIKPGNLIEHKHYIQAEDETIAVYLTRSAYAPGTGPEMRYFHRDPLGSIVVVSDRQGSIIEDLGYEAYGKRRYANGAADPTNTLSALSTTRGFTGHEHLEDVALIHTNGRLYDPVIGRFLSPDPFIQAPDHLQSYNRYTYALNNPFSNIDPSGYFSLKKLLHGPLSKLLIGAAIAIPTYSIALQAFASYTTAAGGSSIFGALSGSGVFTPSLLGGAAGGFASGFAAGVTVSGGDFSAGLTGGLSGGLSGGISTYFGNAYNLTRVGTETLAGGINAKLQGRSFYDGLSSGFVFSGFTYIASAARVYELKHSLGTPGQVGESVGVLGVIGKLGGERINEDAWVALFGGPPSAEDPYFADKLRAYFKASPGGPLGGNQGGPGKIFGFSYASGSLADKVVESYAGIHDLLNHPWFYNANGTSHNFLPQFGIAGDLLGSAINGADVFLASPVAGAALTPDYVRWLTTSRK